MKLQYTCLDSALWPPGHFALGFFASQIGRSKMECSALGFSYVRWKPRNGKLAKMRSFHQSKRSDNKQYAVEVRWGTFLRIWCIFLFLRAVVNIPIQTLIIPPWLLLCKMIISQLELGPPVIWQEYEEQVRTEIVEKVPNLNNTNEPLRRGFIIHLTMLLYERLKKRQRFPSFPMDQPRILWISERLFRSWRQSYSPYLRHVN